LVRPSAAVRNASLLLAFTLRRRYGWCIDANGAGEEVAEQVADRKVLFGVEVQLARVCGPPLRLGLGAGRFRCV
jgi:hypothetical protein